LPREGCFLSEKILDERCGVFLQMACDILDNGVERSDLEGLVLRDRDMVLTALCLACKPCMAPALAGLLVAERG